MEKIELSKGEKKVLRLLNKHGQESLDTMARSLLRRVLRSLESKGLTKVAWVEGGDFEAVRLTRQGRDYLIENPRLRNPRDWKWILTLGVALIGALGSVATLIALLRSCR